MNKKIWIGVLTAAVLAVGGYLVYNRLPEPAVESKFVQEVREETEITPEPDSNEEREEQESVEIVEPGRKALLENPRHMYQSFNNCGPATLAMTLSWYGVGVSQEELADRMRPYQHPEGDNDDKTIFTYEFVDWAEEYDLRAVGRVNGDIELLKKFVANGIPVVVKTWLNPGEDIGHFRIVRGFDEEQKVIIQDDSYQGPNRRISYYDFLSMWQPFNYNYIVVYKPEMEDKVRAILGSEIEAQVAWGNALLRAEKEDELAEDNPYPKFNISTAAYHLGEYERSVEAFEKVEGRLPRRMLWYQIEPILAYKELGEYRKVFEITDEILSDGNEAFSELYIIRGEIYQQRGEIEKAREQYQLAVKYNENLETAKEKLESLN